MAKNQPKNTYLVGGAVRDSLLGLAAAERDWVVVGSSVAEMKAAGFTQVGKDFPVFLHPETQEEYALARRERKIRPGHTGFETDASDKITLEEDLRRRDLTINAIARDEQGNLIDPCHGCEDIESRTIRHVSAAFDEDPLRVLRVARFAARLSPLGFQVTDETRMLCEAMVSRGDLSELASERIFRELDKALAVDHPEIFFRFLARISAAEHLWPELNDASIDLLAKATTGTSNVQRFAILFSHSPVDRIKFRCKQLKAPSHYRALAVNCSQHMSTWSQVSTLCAEEIVGFLYDLDAIRKPDRFREFNDTCSHIVHAQASDCRQQHLWIDYFSIVSNITSTNVGANLRGPAIGKAIKKHQIEAIESYHED
ncbi:MAG: hypothetical protein O6945_06520 [Gammaproteobacteria bacterium]|nr:hypothetical protein [Gammaproteobacteria bacterium]